jgi:RimJ/RimL family protein N-acetyltransferase
MFDLSRVTLIRVTDDHFAFLLGEQTSPFSQPPGGVDSPGVLRLLRGMVAQLHQAGCQGHWLIVDGHEVVGLCGYKRPPDAAGTVEIGYGIAPVRRKRGYGTKAVSLLLEEASADPAIGSVVAETALDNPASKMVLERNGFIRVGVRDDAEGGRLDLWRVSVRG